jgi:hypothetical protein
MSYASAPVDVTFTQQRARKVHELMDSKNVKFRECRDSDAHPNTVPIILALDVTGSMGDVPRQLIADGLPTLMSKVIQAGVADASLMFLAIGDHECDRYPVQAAQFESGDEELDMWLTRTYLEGGGGGNRGESYPLAWEFAASRVQTDAWDKRKEKGFIITIGDEPFLNSFPQSAFKEIYGVNAQRQASATAASLYSEACERYHVFHISLKHGGRYVDDAWTQLLGENHVVTTDHNDVPNLIADLITKTLGQRQTVYVAPAKGEAAPVDTVSPML